VKIELLVADIGSTITIISAFDSPCAGPLSFLGQGQAETSIDAGDVTIGLEKALADLQNKLGEKITWDQFLASSSAAGGLKMSVHGLVYDMTAKAAKEAALGAGAVVSMVTAGELGTDDLERLEALDPRLILLAGGVDYGEKETILKNARHLSDWLITRDHPVPVIYCGNRAVSEQTQQLFSEKGLSLVITENVYPKIDQLNVQPARREIHRAFNRHIVEARGMEKIRSLVEGEIIPTPGAVMEAARLAYEHLEDLLVFDVGGATTDVHSVTDGSEEIQHLLLHPEPRAKRTVEGDLGVYRNAGRVIELCRDEGRLPEDDQTCPEEIKPLPGSKQERGLIGLLTEQALKTALIRHAGSWRYIYGPTGRQTVVEGKDLTRVKTVIGTGGALSQLPGGAGAMERALKGKTGLELLPRGEVVHLIDRYYIMAAAGVLSKSDPDSAWQLLSKSLGL